MGEILDAAYSRLKHWYTPLIIGILFIAFGVFLFSQPVGAYLGLAIFFAWTFLLSGIFEIFFSFSNRESINGWGWYLVSGIFSTVIGIYLLIYPGISAAVLPYVVGFTLMFRSVFALGLAFQHSSMGLGTSWGLILTAVLGLILSFMIISDPLFGAYSIVVMTAVTFIMEGINAAILAFDLKKLKNRVDGVRDSVKNFREGSDNL